MADNGNIVLDGLYLIARASASIKAKAKEYIMTIIGPITSAATVAWADITGKPTGFPPEAHTHVVADITDYVAGNLADGDYGDITVSGTGTTFTIDNAVVTEAKQILVDNTANDVSITKHGYAPKAPNDTAKFLRGDATWSTISNISTREDFRDVSQMNPRAAAATLVVIGTYTRVVAYSFSATTQNQIQLLWRVPEEWKGGAIYTKLYFANSGTSAATIVWRTHRIPNIIAATNLDSIASEVYVTDIVTPSSTQYAMNIHTMSTSFTPTVIGELTNIMLARVPTDASDTNASTMLLVGIGFVYSV